MTGASNENVPNLNPLDVQTFFADRLKVPDGTGLMECRYHYTTPDVLENFLVDEGDLLCTHCRAVNDSREFIVGAKVVIEYMKARQWSKNLIERVVNHVNGATQFDMAMPWIFSLSLYNDSLFQWSNYTDRKEGGYAIGFSEELIEQLTIKRVVKANQNSKLPVSTFFFACLYLGIDDVFAWLDEFFKEHITPGIVYAPSIENHLANEIVSIALMVAMFIKEKSFFIEGEWRLALVPNFDAAYDDVVSIGGRPRLRARIKDDIGLLRDAIKSVVVSPHGRRETLYLNALNLKRRHKANFNVAFSSSSYRGL